jgi:hypothetical protein
VRTQIIAAALVALIATAGSVLLIEFNIRVSRVMDPSGEQEPLQRSRLKEVLLRWNNISAYGQWIAIYRAIAVVVVVGSLISIVLALSI